MVVEMCVATGKSVGVEDGEIDTSSDAIAAMFRVYYLSMTSTSGFYGLGRVGDVQFAVQNLYVSATIGGKPWPSVYSRSSIV